MNDISTQQGNALKGRPITYYNRGCKSQNSSTCILQRSDKPHILSEHYSLLNTLQGNAGERFVLNISESAKIFLCNKCSVE